MEAIDGLKEGVVAILDEVQRWLDGRDGTTLSEWLDRQEAEEAARRRRRTAFHVGRRKGDGTWT